MEAVEALRGSELIFHAGDVGKPEILEELRKIAPVVAVRGNVDTRLRKVLEGEYDAILLAAAGIERLDLETYITEYIPYDVLLPAPGQGALAIQCRSNDAELLQLLQPIHDLPTYRAVTAERAFLAALGGGCSAPVAAYATTNGAQIEMRGLVAGIDNIRLSESVVPEPGTLLLIGSGLTALALRRRRRS